MPYSKWLYDYFIGVGCADGHCLALLGDAKQWSRGADFFLSVPSNNDRFFFLHTLWSPAFDFNVGVAINESRSYSLTSSILKVAIVCDGAMTSTPKVVTTELRDLLYNQCIDNTFCYSFFYLSHGSDKVM